MGARKNYFVLRGVEEAAGRLADPRADAPRGPGRQVHDEHLVERIGPFLLGLENDAFGIRRKITFTGLFEIEGDLLDVLEIRDFPLLPVVSTIWLAEQYDDYGEKSGPHEFILIAGKDAFGSITVL